MKKLAYKEDKLLNKLNINSQLIQREQTQSQIKKTSIRGRQMITKKNLQRQTNTAGNSLKSSHITTTCESREKKLKKMKLTSKMKRFIKKKIKDSKNHDTNFLTVEEEKESSDSDSFYKYKKRKILYEYEEEFLRRQNFNFLDLESHDENKDNSQFSIELNIDNEEILNDEIEKILLDVYNANILSNQKSKEFYLSKYERNVKFLLYNIIVD